MGIIIFLNFVFLFKKYHIKTDFISSYVPHDIAVEGTFIIILGYMPLVNAFKPCCEYNNYIVWYTFM